MPTEQPLLSADPLDQLRPIIPPEHDVSWWPLAPGWWMLMGLLIAVTILIWWLIPKILSHQAEKKRWGSTQELLENLYLECRSKKESPLTLQYYLQKSNAIFKRAIHYFWNDPTVASLVGDEWIKFMERIYSQKNNDYAHLYGQQLYAKSCKNNIKLEELHHWAHEWIKALQKQSKNTHQAGKDD